MLLRKSGSDGPDCSFERLVASGGFDDQRGLTISSGEHRSWQTKQSVTRDSVAVVAAGDEIRETLGDGRVLIDIVRAIGKPSSNSRDTAR
ncbi:hypothetical protein GCM10009682_32020 [Luedemannella flava]|uniref:Uncharacterized protein n=1 Tax=Luedemannella flava TaxID=349316 RepID=A0ABN2M310_9ACTN